MSNMTIDQHREYVDTLYDMLRKIVRLHGGQSPQAESMASVYVAELMEYLRRVGDV